MSFHLEEYVGNVCANYMGCGQVSKYWNEMSKDPWNFPGKNNGVGYHALLQGIFLTQGWNQHLLNCRRNSQELLSLGKPHKYIHTYVYMCVCVCVCVYKPIPPHFMLAQFGVEGSKFRKQNISFQAHFQTYESLIPQVRGSQSAVCNLPAHLQASGSKVSQHCEEES